MRNPYKKNKPNKSNRENSKALFTNRVKNILFISLLASMLYSCERDANIDVPESKPELVVASFLSPGKDTVGLKLSWSTPIYNYSGNYNQSEPNAQVVLKVGNKSYPMTYNATDEMYWNTNANFKANDHISLSINYKNQEYLYADCSIPEPPSYEMKYLGKKLRTTSYGDIELVFEYEFTCKNSNSNYYRLCFAGYQKYTKPSYPETFYPSEGEMHKLSYNESVKIHLSRYLDFSAWDSIKYFVIRSDEAYYKYHNSVLNYQGDGFFVEPSIIYNNIDGGIGILGAYNMETNTTVNP